MLEAVWQRILMMTRPALRLPSFADRLAALTEASGAFVARRRSFLAIVVSERAAIAGALGGRVGQALERHRKVRRRQVVELMKGGLAEGVLRFGDAEFLASAYLGLLTQCQSDALAVGRGRRPRATWCRSFAAGPPLTTAAHVGRRDEMSARLPTTLAILGAQRRAGGSCPGAGTRSRTARWGAATHAGPDVEPIPWWRAARRGDRGTAALGLRDAIDQALAHNLGVLLQEQGLETARGSRWQSLSGLLPDVSAGVGEARRVSSLAEFGFTEFPGLTSTSGGPFNVFDTRVDVSQPVLDISALQRRACGPGARYGGQHDVKNARELVVLVVATSISARWPTRAGSTRHGRLETADALYQPHERSKSAGIAAGVDMLRHRFSSRPNASGSSPRKTMRQGAAAARARRGFAARSGCDADRCDPYAPMQQLSLEAALQRAYATRPDYSPPRRCCGRGGADRAARTSLLPSLQVNGEAGASASRRPKPISSTAWSASVARSRLRPRAAAGAHCQPRQPNCNAAGRSSADMRGTSTSRSVGVSRVHRRRTVSGGGAVGARPRRQQLIQARDRFSAGVAGSLEVVQSQEALAARQRQLHVRALRAQHRQSDPRRAIGVAEDAIKAFSEAHTDGRQRLVPRRAPPRRAPVCN